MDVSIRAVRASDSEAIAAILNRIIETGLFTAFDTPVSVEAERAYIERFPARGVFLVAERSDDRQVVGFQSMDYRKIFTYIRADNPAALTTYVNHGSASSASPASTRRLVAGTWTKSSSRGFYELASGFHRDAARTRGAGIRARDRIVARR
jgi:hypothetical protein